MAQPARRVPKLFIPSDEPRDLLREVAGGGVAAQPRELGRQRRMHELEEQDRIREVFEPVVTERRCRRAIRHISVDEHAGGIGQNDLAATRG